MKIEIREIEDNTPLATDNSPPAAEIIEILEIMLHSHVGYKQIFEI